MYEKIKIRDHYSDVAVFNILKCGGKVYTNVVGDFVVAVNY